MGYTLILWGHGPHNMSAITTYIGALPQYKKSIIMGAAHYCYSILGARPPISLPIIWAFGPYYSNIIIGEYLGPYGPRYVVT